MRRLVIGDIHNGYKSMRQVLDRAGFDEKNDLLIGIGDYVDGWPDAYETVDYLMNLPNFKGVIGNHDCFSEDTEALTDSGWKKYKDITMNDKILSIDTENGTLIWDKINKIIIKNHNGPMYHFENIHINMLLTGTHRVLYQKRSGKKWGDYKYSPIKGLSGRVRIPTGGICHKEGISLTDDEIRFIAWVLTGGHISKGPNKTYYHIYQSKQSTKNRIEEILNRLEYSFNKNTRTRDIKTICGVELKKPSLPHTTFSISSEDSQKIKEFFPEKRPFPKILFEMNNEQFNIFIKEIILADGVYYNRGRDSDTSILFGEKEFLDAIQILCIQNNKRAVLVKDSRGDYRLNISDYTSTSFDVEDKIKEVQYNGEVWCLSVPQTNFFVRRNGKAYFSGNSWAIDFLEYRIAPHIWISQGGQATYDSYLPYINEEVAQKHLEFLKSLPYYLEIGKKLFVHGGIYVDEDGVGLNVFANHDIIWDRGLFKKTVYNKYESGGIDALSYKFSIEPYEEIYIGHTTTQMADPTFKPVDYKGVYLIDQGAGWDGKLTVMDIDTKEYWQSDFTPTLYPEVKGRF